MNTAFFDYCIKSLKRRKKQVLKTVMAIFLSFTFVAGVLLFKNNMYEWQIQSAKHRFGDWFVMMNGNDSRENTQLKSHPYLNDSGKVSISNTIITGVRQILKSDIWIMILSVFLI